MPLIGSLGTCRLAQRITTIGALPLVGRRVAVQHGASRWAWPRYARQANPVFCSPILKLF